MTRQRFNLADLPWQLTGWHPNHWHWGLLAESPRKLGPDVAAIPARVPGSVQQALLGAGLLPDWNDRLASRQCEWVENRHWLFQTTLPAAWTAFPGRKILHCSGLDYQGVILINGREVGVFRNSLVPHAFDLTAWLCDGPNQLAVVFTDIPAYLGQIGYTSKMRDFKPRFNYIWDWVPRLVQIGIWDAMHLAVDQGDAIDGLFLYTQYDIATMYGEITLAADLSITAGQKVEIIVEGEEGEIHRSMLAATTRMRHAIKALPVRAWHPNGAGAQLLYLVRFRLLDQTGRLLDEETRCVGFRAIAWKPCRGAPAGAEPWICNINGVDTFLQGFNWVPLRPHFADVTEEDYRRRLETYRDLGTNILRVWGGAVLEKECFYRLCDEMGILVWQEFPLSSSGLDNWPPEDGEFRAEMRRVATSYIRHRQHHPCLLLWCGGNELQGSLNGGKQGEGKPVDLSHPLSAMLAQLVRELDPGRRFLGTSASGPRATAAAEDFGKGLHHDVHGPWNHTGSLESWFDYWRRDDALFRSEVGMPGAESTELIRRHGKELAWPGNQGNPFWVHAAAWWIQWEDYLASGGDAASLEDYVAWSQQRQAMALAYAARCCKERFFTAGNGAHGRSGAALSDTGNGRPQCGGFILWMGHDCFPCPVNTSVIDFDGRLKPATAALAEVFHTPSGADEQENTAWATVHAETTEVIGT